MNRSKGFYTLILMVLLSLALGIFTSYFFVFVNSLFISEIGPSKLPLVYVFSGIGGTLITWLFNMAERKWGFAKSSTSFCLVFAVVMFSIWYIYVQGENLHVLIFFSYAWLYVSINFTTLVFWKLPSNIFDLNENKKYNSIISSGEVISNIIAYLTVPALLNLEFFTRDKLLLISFFGISVFSIITFLLSQRIKFKKPGTLKNQTITADSKSSTVVKETYFQLIFLSVFLAVIIQLLIDFSLMEVSSKQMSDPDELAKYFAFLYGGMRLLELILKTFVSKYMLKEYGIFVSLITLIVTLGIIVIIGISSLIIGYAGLILIVASLSKVFERSLYRSIYAPTINVLYQAYPTSKRNFTQNYADGFGKTIGQLMAAALIFAIGSFELFETRVLVLLLSVLCILIVWFILSKRLVFFYKIELSNILKLFDSRDISTGSSSAAVIIPTDKFIINEKSTSEMKIFEKNNLPVGNLIDYMKTILAIEIQVKDQYNEQQKEFWNQNLASQSISEFLVRFIDAIHEYDSNELIYLLNFITLEKENTYKNSKFLKLIHLCVCVSLINKNTKFNFYQESKKLRSVDFLSSALIQNLAKKQILKLNDSDYYYLLEERIQKYTYLLASHRDLGKSKTILSTLILFEVKATKLDILFSLNFRHEQSILSQISNMLNQNEKSEELIALELLELVLAEQEKKWILPLFREDQTDSILNKLEADFPQVFLGKERRLLSLLGNNLQDIPQIIKSETLKELTNCYPNPEYEKLAITYSRSASGIVKYTASQLIQTKAKLNDQSFNNPTDFELLNKNAINAQGSDLSTSLQYFYWINNSDPSNQKHYSMDSIYRILFHHIFPMERLN